MRYTEDPLFADGRRRHPALTLFLLLILTVSVIVLVLNHINNSRVDLLRETVTVPNLPASLEGYRILHISDLHGLFFGKNQERLRDTLAAARYDAVCITGDVTGKDGSADAFLALIGLFDPEATPVYFILGDEDPSALAIQPDGSGPKREFIREAEALGAVYLDAPVKLVSGKTSLWLSPEWAYTLDITGLDAQYEQRLNQARDLPDSPEKEGSVKYWAYQLELLERLRSARREMLEGDVHVAVTHHPLQLSALQTLQEWTSTDNDSYVRTVSLVLAGHYVGGQWRLPGVGAVRAPLSAETGGGGWFPEDIRVTGLSSFLGIPQYISPGLGTSREIGLPPFRLFNTPAVTVLTLTSRLTH